MTIFADTLPLASVRDQDRIVSFRPLVFDMTSREVSGVDAILRRILYRWCSSAGSLRWALTAGLRRPLLDLEATTFSQTELRGYQTSLQREAGEVDYVLSARVTVTFADGTLTIVAWIKLVDGRVYPLEVALSQAGAALLAIGRTA